MENLEDEALDYAVGEAENDNNLGKPLVKVAEDGFIAGAKWFDSKYPYILEHMANIIILIEELEPVGGMIRHSNSYRNLKKMIGL